MAELAQTSKKRMQGIPAFVCTWTNPNTGTGSIVASIFSEVSKSPGAGVNYEQVGNDAELSGLVTGRRFIDSSFSCVAFGTDAAAAQTLAEACPFINTEIVITHGTAGTDVQLEGITYCQSATVRYVTDGDCVFDITTRKYIDAAGSNVDLTP